jgi:hypothetical protein
MGPGPFKTLVELIYASGHMRDSVRVLFGGHEQRIPLNFKIAAALFWLGHGGSITPAAAVAGLGNLTLILYLRQFCVIVILHLKPVYMPVKPSTLQLELIRRAFTLRRGINDVGLTLDGTTYVGDSSTLLFGMGERHPTIKEV